MRRKAFACVALSVLFFIAGPVSSEDTTPHGANDAKPVGGDRGEPETAQPTGKGTARLKEIVVEAKRPLSAASSDEIRARDYELRPHGTTQEILNNVPGLVVAQHQGGGKAAQYLVRGFDADHGTDFAVFVDGLPVNMVSHGHGQGYADLNFLIPETVDRLQLYKGPYFAEFGDFANAGALRILTKEEFEEEFAHAEGGSFDTQRYVVGVSPRLGATKTLLAAQAYFSNGPFLHEQNFARYNAVAKLTLAPTTASKLAVAADVYQSDWDGSGQIPLREVAAGRLNRFGAVDATEGGRTDRENLNLRLTWTPSAADELSFQIYGSRYKLRLWSNFTFFKDTGLRFLREGDGRIVDTRGAPRISEANYIPGDGIEQNDHRLLYGGRLHYTRLWTLLDLANETQVAVETRHDDIDLALHRQVRRHRFFTRNKLNVDERSVGGFLRHQVFLSEWMRLDAGLRGDVFFFDARDRLPVQEEDPNFDPVKIAGYTHDSIVSPKINLIVTPVESTDVYANLGWGFHSNDARNAILGRDSDFSPLVRSTGYELGARTRQFDRVDFAASLWLLDLESELVFSGDGGNQETGAGGTFVPSAATRRWGVDFETRYQITRWLVADYDLSYADPRFRRSGEAIPLAPTLLMNGGVTLDLDNGFSAALRVRYLDDRPAIENRSLIARGYTLLDLLAKYRWRNVEASLALLNLTDTDWREAQFSDTSCVLREVGVAAGCVEKPAKQDDPDSPAQDVADDIHFTPGNPFGVRAGLTVYF